MTEPIRLLALDDDPFVRELLERGLTREGFAVSTVASAGEAAHALEREVPDLVLVDVNVPGMTHGDVAALTKAHAHMRFILFSADDPGKLKRLCADVGAHSWLSKSAPLDELARSLRKILSSGAAR